MSIPIPHQIEYWYLIVSENDLKYIKALDGPEYRFRQTDLVENVFTSNLYVQTRLSSDQKIFTKQINIFIQSGMHPAICRFVGFSYFPNRYAYTKFYKNSTLSHILRDIKVGVLHPEWNGTMKSKCVFGIVAALTHLHNLFDDHFPNFSIHYFSTENIAFNSKFEPKIVNYEFGDEDLISKSNAYIPPELHIDSKGSRKFEDVWAFGMVLYEILTSNHPYEGKSEDEIKAAIINGELPELPPPSEETDDIVGIIQNCLEKEPENRPEFFMIFSHLLDLTDDLFPETDKNVYQSYKDSLLIYTTQTEESVGYMTKNDLEEEQSNAN